jgi:hypothetical protein
MSPEFDDREVEEQMERGEGEGSGRGSGRMTRQFPTDRRTSLELYLLEPVQNRLKAALTASKRTANER